MDKLTMCAGNEAAALTERTEIAESFGYWVDGRQQSVSEFAAVNL